MATTAARRWGGSSGAASSRRAARRARGAGGSSAVKCTALLRYTVYVYVRARGNTVVVATRRNIHNIDKRYCRVLCLAATCCLPRPVPACLIVRVAAQQLGESPLWVGERVVGITRGTSTGWPMAPTRTTCDAVAWRGGYFRCSERAANDWIKANSSTM